MTQDTPQATKIIYKRPFLYPKQEAILFAAERYAFCEASTKAGKTHGCIVWLVEQAALNGAVGRNFWWVAPVGSQAKIAFRRIKNSLPAGMFKANESEGYIELLNGARIWFKSAEKPDNLYGEDVYAAVYDEASRGRYDSYIALRSTLTATRGPLRLIGNVKGKSNWFYITCRAVERGRDNSKYGRITAFDAIEAGVLHPDEIKDAQATLPEKEFQELYMAIAMDDEEAFMPSRFVEEAMTKERWNQAYVTGPVIIGADPSQGKRDAAAFAIRQGNKVLSIEEHFGMDEEAFLGYLIRLIKTSGAKKAFIDGTGFGTTIARFAQSEGYGDIIEPIHMAVRSDFPDEYANMRAQCWGNMRKAIMDKTDLFALPDDEGLAVELTCLRRSVDRSGRLLLESKDDLFARGYSSPNKADAVSLTFAKPVEFYIQKEITYPITRRRAVLS